MCIWRAFEGRIATLRGHMAELHQHDTEAFWKNVGSEFSEQFSVGAAAYGARLANFVMSDSPDDMKAPLASMFYMPPNFVLAKHAHDCHRVEVVIQGSLRVGDTVLKPGDVSISKPGEPYGPHVAGPTGCLTVEIFSRQAALDPILHSDAWSDASRAQAATYRRAVEDWKAQRAAATAEAE